MKRFLQNPLISPEDVTPSVAGWKVLGTYNAGAFRYENKIGLLLRVIERPVLDDPNLVGAPLWDFSSGTKKLVVKTWKHDEVDVTDPRFVKAEVVYDAVMNHLRLAWSDDGINFKVDDHPILEGEDKLANLGVNDPRVLFMEGEYKIIFTANSLWGITMRLVTTTDWVNFKNLGIIFPPDNKDVALFPEKIGGRYACLHRPAGMYFGGHDLWLAYSPDMVHWGDHKLVATRRPGMWDSARIGCGAESIKTDDGWLQIYHGSDGTNYFLGAMLLDLDDPSKVLARSSQPLLKPEADYELYGYFNNVVFSTGFVQMDEDNVYIYYGGADKYLAGASYSIKQVIAGLREDAK